MLEPSALAVIAPILDCGSAVDDYIVVGYAAAYGAISLDAILVLTESQE